MSELISVIIPVYKVEPYLARCVDSVLAQTYEDLEIILVDDGSPDRCPALCDAYAERDRRVRVIHQENAGLSGARNTGIEAARGNWLAFVDSDDFLAPDFVESLYGACMRTGSQLGICRWVYARKEQVDEIAEAMRRGVQSGGPAEHAGVCAAGEKKTEEKKAAEREETVYTGRELMANLYIPDGAYYVVAWNKLYRRELWEGIRYPLGQIHEDEATTYRIFHRTKKGVFVDRPLYGYFVTPVSITRGFNPRRLDWIRGVGERIDFLEHNGYEELMPAALRAYADGMIDIYFGLADFQPENRAEQERIRKLVSQGLRRVRPYGRFPLRTAIGYALFVRAPGLYRKLLNHVKAETGKQ